MVKSNKGRFVFCEVTKGDKYYIAQCLEADIFSQGETEEEALKSLQEAVELYFEDEEMPLGIPDPIHQSLNERPLTIAINVC